ncbi:hypothetical protein J6590_003050 [Homalodisca vitripennis]|nr:hypothetical protein J6590_003050 [Homalodisca vitripennis]
MIRERLRPEEIQLPKRITYPGLLPLVRITTADPCVISLVYNRRDGIREERLTGRKGLGEIDRGSGIYNCLEYESDLSGGPQLRGWRMNQIMSLTSNQLLSATEYLQFPFTEVLTTSLVRESRAIWIV